MLWKVYRIKTPIESYEVKAKNIEHVRKYIGHARLRYLDMSVWSVKGLSAHEWEVKITNTGYDIKVGKGSKYVKRIEAIRKDIPFSNHETNLNKPKYRLSRPLVAKSYAGTLAYGVAIPESDEDFISMPFPIQSELDGKTKFTRISGDDAMYTVWDIAEMCLVKGGSIPAYEYVFSPLIECNSMEIYIALRNLIRDNFAVGMLRGLWGSFNEHAGIFADPKPVVLKKTGVEKHSAEYMKRKGLTHMWRCSTVALSIGKNGCAVFPCGDAKERKTIRDYREHGTNEKYILNKVAWNIEQLKGTIKPVSKKVRLKNLEKFRTYLSQVIGA